MPLVLGESPLRLDSALNSSIGLRPELKPGHGWVLRVLGIAAGLSANVPTSVEPLFRPDRGAGDESRRGLGGEDDEGLRGAHEGLRGEDDGSHQGLHQGLRGQDVGSHQGLRGEGEW